MNISPAVGSIRRLICRTNVDLPEPNNPIMTKIRAAGIRKLMSLSPTLQSSVSRIWALLRPLRNCFNASCSRRPKILTMLRTSILIVSAWIISMLRMRLCALEHGALTRREAICLADAIDHDGQDDDGEPGLQTGAGVQRLDALQHIFTQAACADHRCDHHHAQSHHGRLVDAGHDAGPR